MKTKNLYNYAKIVRLKAEGRTHKEVARMVNCSIGTVTLALNYCKKSKTSRRFNLRVGDDYLRLRLVKS